VLRLVPRIDPDGGRRVDPELGRRQLEDEPPGMCLDELEANASRSVARNASASGSVV
jgi:hypothetical protein